MVTLTGSFADDSQAHVLTIDWGDGNVDTINLAQGVFSIPSATVHTYADENSDPYQITVTVATVAADQGSAVSDSHLAITVNDAPLTGSDAAAVGGAEGQTDSSVLAGATFTDANPGDHTGDFTATIDWGDGGPTSLGIVTYSGGVYTVSGSHTYAEEGGYPISIGVLDNGGQGHDHGHRHGGRRALTGSSGATAGGTEEAADSSVLAGATFTDANPGDHTGDFTATIDWGDGGPTSLGIVTYSGGVYTVSGAHTYAEEGSYPINIDVADGGGQTAAITGTATLAMRR